MIDDLFLAMGLKNLCKNAQKKAHRKNLLRRVEIAIERRHEIVHKGDLTDHGKLHKIDCDEMAGRIEDVKLFVEMCDEIIDRRIK